MVGKQGGLVCCSLWGHKDWIRLGDWTTNSTIGFPAGSDGKEFARQCGRHRGRRLDPWVRKIPWRRKWQPTPVFLPWKLQGQRRLMGYSPWGHKEPDVTERLTRFLFLLKHSFFMEDVLPFGRWLKLSATKTKFLCWVYGLTFLSKTSISALLTMPKPLTVWVTISNSQNWTWNNRLDPNRKRSTSRLYVVALLI